MKKYFPFLICCIIFNSLQAQVYTTTTSLPLDLTATNVAAPTCATANPRIANIPVAAGLPALGASFSVGKINIQFLEDCAGNSNTSVNLGAVRIFLRSPAGTCVQIYNGGFSSVATGTYEVSFVNSASCLNAANTSNAPTAGPSATGQGNYGLYNATSDIVTAFSGQNPTGTWQLLFFENTASEPCLGAASIEFGDFSVSDLTAQGDNCSSPIVWNGGAFCAQTNGRTPSTQMPGSSSAGPNSFTANIGGGACSWNAANNNDVWIAFVANVTNPCINISGSDLSLQSIVVSDANADGDNNPCTGARPATGGAGTNDPRWTLASCPRNSIYTTTAGTQLSQNHCFTAVVGQTYYLVVDGNGGVESPFYINGVNPVITAPVALVDFWGDKSDEGHLLRWLTESEMNSDYFSLERSADGISFEEIGRVNAADHSDRLSSYQYLDPQPLPNTNYYRLLMVDYDNSSKYSDIIALENKNYIENYLVYISDNHLFINGSFDKNNLDLSLFATNGQLIIHQNTAQPIPMHDLAAGLYVLRIAHNGVVVHKKIWR